MIVFFLLSIICAIFYHRGVITLMLLLSTAGVKRITQVCITFLLPCKPQLLLDGFNTPFPDYFHPIFTVKWINFLGLPNMHWNAIKVFAWLSSLCDLWVIWARFGLGALWVIFWRRECWKPDQHWLRFQPLKISTSLNYADFSTRFQFSD